MLQQEFYLHRFAFLRCCRDAVLLHPLIERHSGVVRVFVLRLREQLQMLLGVIDPEFHLEQIDF